MCKLGVVIYTRVGLRVGACGLPPYFETINLVDKKTSPWQHLLSGTGIEVKTFDIQSDMINYDGLTLCWYLKICLIKHTTIYEYYNIIIITVNNWPWPQCVVVAKLWPTSPQYWQQQQIFRSRLETRLIIFNYVQYSFVLIQLISIISNIGSMIRYSGLS